MKKITFLATALLMSLGSFAQQALFDNAPVISPEVNANHTVTFRLKAPNAQRCRLLVISWHRKPLIHHWESMMLLE